MSTDPPVAAPRARRRAVAVLVGLGAGALGTLGLVAVSGFVVAHLSLPEVARDCAVDETLSGHQGYCVVVSARGATLASQRAAELAVVPVVDGELSPYRFATPYPFGYPSDDDWVVEVDWADVDDHVTVTRDGVTVTYPIESYGYQTGR